MSKRRILLLDGQLRRIDSVKELGEEQGRQAQLRIRLAVGAVDDVGDGEAGDGHGGVDDRPPVASGWG